MAYMPRLSASLSGRRLVGDHASSFSLGGFGGPDLPGHLTPQVLIRPAFQVRICQVLIVVRSASRVRMLDVGEPSPQHRHLGLAG